MKKEMHDTAWYILEKKGLSLGERIKVRQAFATWGSKEDEFPFIVQNGSLFHSSHESISFLNFETVQEVIIINTIYEIKKGDIDVNKISHEVSLVNKMFKP